MLFGGVDESGNSNETQHVKGTILLFVYIYIYIYIYIIYIYSNIVQQIP